MQLHTIKAGLDGVICRLVEQLNIFFDLRNREFAWDLIIEGDGAGCDDIKITFLPEDDRIGSASKSPKL